MWKTWTINLGTVWYLEGYLSLCCLPSSEKMAAASRNAGDCQDPGATQGAEPRGDRPLGVH